MAQRLPPADLAAVGGPNTQPPAPLILASIAPEQMAPPRLARRVYSRAGEDEEADPDSSTGAPWEPAGHVFASSTGAKVHTPHLR